MQEINEISMLKEGCTSFFLADSTSYNFGPG